MIATRYGGIFLSGWAILLLSTSLEAQSLPSSLKIVVLGSSSAAGMGASTSDSAWVWRYTAILKQMNSKYEVINLAKGGYTSYHLQADGFIPPEGRPSPDADRNITRALSYFPDAILLNLPSNDAASDLSLIEQSENFDRIVAEASAAAVQIWVTTTQPRNLSEARRQNLITMRDLITTRYGVRLIDFWTDVAAEDGSILPWANSGDGVHLSDAAHALCSERVRQANIPEHIGDGTTIKTFKPIPKVRIFSQRATEHASVHVALGSPGEFTFLLYDILGRRVRDIQRGSSQSDEVRFDVSLQQLPVGSYPWVLLAGGRVRTGHLSVVH